MTHFIGYAIVFAVLFGCLGLVIRDFRKGRNQKRKEAEGFIQSAEDWNRKEGK